MAGGLVAGVALAMMFVRVIQGFLYGVQPMDPTTLLGVGATLGVVGVMAATGPARSAARMSVGEALSDAD